VSRPSQYKTKQSEAILSYIASSPDAHVTAKQIVAHFENCGTSIGLTTVYRHLDKLAGSGKVRQYVTDGTSCAYYQYVSEATDTPEHFHLKCDGCGELLHLDCAEVSELQQHINNEHSFQINPMKTVFYGKCQTCCLKDSSQGIEK